MLTPGEITPEPYPPPLTWQISRGAGCFSAFALKFV